MSHRINHIAVWLLVIVDQAIGALWYSMAFIANHWIAYHGKRMEDADGSDYTPFIVSIIAAIATNYALAWLLCRLSVTTIAGALKLALLCWFAFVFVDYATITSFSAFGRNPWILICIDMGRTFLVFALAGLVLGSWPRRPQAVLVS